MLAIMTKEFRQFFSNPMGYIVSAIFLLVFNLYFVIYNMSAGYAKLEYVLQSTFILLVIYIPIMTMNTFTEEYKNKTDQLLLTAPVSVEKIVFGKLFGNLCSFLVVFAPILLYPLLIGHYGEGVVNYKATYFALFMYLLLILSYTAIGMFISSLCESTLVSFMVTAVVILFSYFMPSLSGMIDNDNKTTFIVVSVLIVIFAFIVYLMAKSVVAAIALGAVLEIAATIVFIVKATLYDNVLSKLFDCIGIITPFQKSAQGMVDLSNIVFYLSIIAVFLFLNIQIIKKKRWS